MKHGTRPSEILARNIEAVRAIIARYPVANPRVFGSVARGEDTAASDLDIIVDPVEDTTLFHLAGIKIDLEALLGIQVDIATPDALRPQHRERVLRDAKTI